MSESVLRPGTPWGAYPERREETLSWLDETGERLAGALLRRLRTRQRLGLSVASRTAALAARCEDLSDEALRSAANDLRDPLRRNGYRTEEVAQCFALIREAARRTLGKPHFDVQLRGGFALLSGCVAEMETGEGKTLTATLAAATAALAGMPVHVITVNDYLVGRDAEEMGPIYRALGLSVGAIQHDMDPSARRAEYACDVTYCSNKELAFDYLRDRLVLGNVRSRARLQLEGLCHGQSRADRLVLRGLCFGIVDEVDSALVDEARTPLIISGSGKLDELEEQIYATAVMLAGKLEPLHHFAIDARERRAQLTEAGDERLAQIADSLGGVWSGPHRRAEFVTQALTALHLFERERQYLVKDDKVQIIDEYTGRVMPDRTWQRGLHQMIEAKEGVPITASTEPLAKISYQRFFRRFQRLAGMTGTGREVAGELWNVYGLAVQPIPTNRALQRRDHGTRIFATADARWQAVVERIEALHDEGRPILVGTRSVAASDHLSQLLDDAVLPNCVLNARQDEEEAEVIALAGRTGRITVATNMAGRGTDIRLAPEVVEAGGLHVIATELHEAGRVDRQLFGRCGRQGDPGSYEALISLEDGLFRAHGRGLDPLVRKSQQSERATDSRWRRLAATIAQRRAQRLHAGIRRALLKVDEQIASMLAFSGAGE